MLLPLACTIASATSATSFAKELAALHSVREPDGLPCNALFIDIGANIGMATWDFLQRLNCYESCGGNSTCRPENWSAQSCQFCNTANMNRQCGWMWPWWLPRDVRQRYCAVAFEPNPGVSSQLHARIESLRRLLPGVSVRVVNDTAVSVRDGEATFGIDTGAYEGRSSSLALSRVSPRAAPNASEPKLLGVNVEVGAQQRLRVKTLDLVHYLRALHAVPTVGMWLDAEGSEFELLRDLLSSGALCGRVDNLWMDWHPTRIAWAKERLPISDVEMHKMYNWMLTSMDNRAKHQTGTADPDAHCKTAMFTVGQR